MSEEKKKKIQYSRLLVENSKDDAFRLLNMINISTFFFFFLKPVAQYFLFISFKLDCSARIESYVQSPQCFIWLLFQLLVLRHQEKSNKIASHQHTSLQKQYFSCGHFFSYSKIRVQSWITALSR